MAGRVVRCRPNAGLGRGLRGVDDARRYRRSWNPTPGRGGNEGRFLYGDPDVPWQDCWQASKNSLLEHHSERDEGVVVVEVAAGWVGFGVIVEAVQIVRDISPVLPVDLFGDYLTDAGLTGPRPGTRWFPFILLDCSVEQVKEDVVFVDRGFVRRVRFSLAVLREELHPPCAQDGVSLDIRRRSSSPVIILSSYPGPFCGGGPRLIIGNPIISRAATPGYSCSNEGDDNRASIHILNK